MAFDDKHISILDMPEIRLRTTCVVLNECPMHIVLEERRTQYEDNITILHQITVEGRAIFHDEQLSFSCIIADCLDVRLQYINTLVLYSSKSFLLYLWCGKANIDWKLCQLMHLKMHLSFLPSPCIIINGYKIHITSLTYPSEHAAPWHTLNSRLFVCWSAP